MVERQGQGKINVRLRQSNHNHNHNYNLMGFDTIEINLVRKLFWAKNIYDFKFLWTQNIFVQNLFLDQNYLIHIILWTLISEQIFYALSC